MPGFTLTLDRLLACLAGVEPLALTGMALFNQRHAAANGHILAPPDRDLLRQATLELIAYTQRCQRWLSRVSQLAPIPLTTLWQPEFGL